MKSCLAPIVLLLVCVGAEARDPPLNRLAKERSPYLRQHATNPVDWHPWGPAALALARRLDKPIFLSIGYAACHWCHVMEHESFEHVGTARLLNRAFVCVKVDREERPDLDRIYMNAVVLLAGRGGWPMTVILTPDTHPYWGGTYLPRRRLESVIQRESTRWRNQKSAVRSKAAENAAQVAAMSRGPRLAATRATDVELLRFVRLTQARRFDDRHAGYAGRTKFPPHASLLFFLEEGSRFATQEDWTQVRRTLDAMEEGGFQDHVGGGFHRYTVDSAWLVPHFEKMLYDNALLARAYAAMYRRTKNPRYKRVADRAFDWMERILRRPTGGYASSLDADTAGHEGLTYVWSQGQIRNLLRDPQYSFALRLFGITRGGNWEEGLFSRSTGRNIIHLPRALATYARPGTPEHARVVERMDAILLRLRGTRTRRRQPALDEKVITSWNGLMLSALARASRDLGDARYRERAEALASHLLTHHRTQSGTLLRFARGSGPELMGFCEDYVHLIAGLLDLHAVTGAAGHLAAARDLGTRLLRGFEDTAGGGFYASSHRGHERLIVRHKNLRDSPIPADNAVAAQVCLRLATETGEAAFRVAADRTLAAYRPLLGQSSWVPSVMSLAHALALRHGLERRPADGPLNAALRLRQDVVRVDVYTDRQLVRASTPLRVLVRVQLDPGWHVLAREASNTDRVGVQLSGQGTARQSEVRYPTSQRHLLGGEALAVYAGSFDIRARLTLPSGTAPGTLTLPLHLTLQVCDEATCKEPMEIDLPLSLSVAESDGPLQNTSLFR